MTTDTPTPQQEADLRRMAEASVFDALYTLVDVRLSLYEAAVARSNLAEDTKRTYVVHARRFVRWLRGEWAWNGE